MYGNRQYLIRVIKKSFNFFVSQMDVHKYENNNLGSQGKYIILLSNFVLLDSNFSRFSASQVCSHHNIYTYFLKNPQHK